MPSFACDCSADVDEPAEFARKEFPVALKEHICCECEAKIKPGEKYERATLFFDGSFSQYKTCIPCQSIRDHYCPHGFYYGMLQEQIEECLGFNYLQVPEDDDE